ncbi:hypothetical protein [Metallibacterium sp.]|jgi:hypothetical protein|uniref:hypothetical protein n=1 Tax=Metallibacterium sp. TaxID=2940281 RepID=UPI002603B5DB|nr:hypothetical protein [Metallibacterium sp.]
MGESMAPEDIAIRDYILKRTIPILYNVPDRGVLPNGTGTLLRVEDRIFVITACHVFDEGRNFAEFSYPIHPSNGGISTFGSYALMRPTDGLIDIAIAELTDAQTKKSLSANWQFCTLSDVCTPPPEGSFIIAGYPESMIAVTDTRLISNAVMVKTERSSAPTNLELPARAEFELFLKFGRKATSQSGSEIYTPRMKGVSGASVWVVVESASITWSPASLLRVVGVLWSVDKLRFMRATDWRAVARALQNIFPDNAELKRIIAGDM